MGSAARAIGSLGLAVLGVFTGQPWLVAIGFSGLSRSLAPRPKKPNATAPGSVPTNYSSTDQPTPFIYGTVRTGGLDILPGFTSGTNGEYLHRAIVHGVGRIDDIGDCYLDDTLLPNSALSVSSPANHKAIYSVVSHASINSKGNSSYGGYLDIQKSLGTNSHLPSSQLVTAFGQPWSYFLGNGLAWSELRYKLNSDHNNYTGLPQTTFVVRGLWCYDPRKDSTVSGGSGSHRFSDPTTWEHTSCPPLCLAHFLTHTLAGRYQYDEISWQTVMTAADTCDALVNVPSGTQKRYTCNGIVYAPLTPEDFIDTVKKLAASMLGNVIYTNGVWEIYAGTWKTPTWTIDRKDLVIRPKYQLEGGSKVRYNRVLGWFNSSSRNYERSPVIRSNSTYMVADGGILPKDVDLPMCTDEYEAIRRAEFLLRQSRNQITQAAQIPPRFSDIGMYETGTMVDSYKGWSSKTFRVVSNVINVDGSYMATIKEEQSTDWTDPSTTDYVSQLSSHSLPAVNALTPSAPSNLTVTPNVDGTLTFAIGKPVLNPPDTEYQLIRSTNSGDASVGTVVWQGNVLRADLVMPTSRHWYYTRSLTNSYLSDYYPNTYGVFGLAQATADATQNGYIVSDPEIENSVVNGDFWVHSATAVFSLQATGGLVAGKLTIVNSQTAAFLDETIYSVPKQPYRRNRTGQYVGKVRMRVNSLQTFNATGTAARLQFKLLGWTGATPVNSSNTFSAGAMVMAEVVLYDVADGGFTMPSTGTWIDYTGTAILVGHGDGGGASTCDPTSYPYLVAGIKAPDGNDGLGGVNKYSIEVDRAEVFFKA